MATQFAQPQLAMPLPAGHNIYNTSNQYTLYNNQPQPISPVQSMPGTPQGQSPTSPRTSFINSQARQLRPLKSPMYVPAVLRPTDRPSRKSNKSTSGSSPPKGSNDSIYSSDTASLTGVTRHDTMDSAKAGLGKIQENEFMATRMYGEVTGFPTQRHWKSDASAQICDAPACHQTFSLFNRRHHCRRCGNIFCDIHSAKAVRLDQEANYHPHGEHVRACDFCHLEYQNWESVRSRSNSQDSFSTSSTSDATSEGTATPTISCKGKIGTGLKGVFGKGGVAESLGASVSRDWNWSTF